MFFTSEKKCILGSLVMNLQADVIQQGSGRNIVSRKTNTGKEVKASQNFNLTFSIFDVFSLFQCLLIVNTENYK